MPDHPPSPRKRRFLWLVLGVVIIAACVLAATGLSGDFNLTLLQAQAENWQSIVTAHTILTGVGYAFLYALVVALSLPVATLLTLLAGFLFGLVPGTLIVVCGATAGASLVFLLARSTIGAALRARAGPLYQKTAAHMNSNAVGYMLFMRLVPVFPFVLVNVVPALFAVKLRAYVITTFIGILPGTAIYVNLGRTLRTIDSTADLVSPQVLGALALLGVVALIPTLYKLYKDKRAHDPS